MNAWTGLILWGEATGDTALRDLGVYLYTTEMNAINEYWFDVHGENFPKDYTPSVVTMVWGGKGANATWFSARPEHVHGINWLPIHGGSLYLGRYPDYVEKNYAALRRGERRDQLEGVGRTSSGCTGRWSIRRTRIKQFEAAKDKVAFEGGNSKANTYHWIYSLNELGQVDAGVTADYPLFAVFRKGKKRTYCVYNGADKPRTVIFSDGFELKAGAGDWAAATGEK